MHESFGDNLASSLPDHDLLCRFRQDTDQIALAEIFRRQGALVMGICRRIVGDHADADDAFQAVLHRARVGLGVFAESNPSVTGCARLPGEQV